MPRQKVKIDIAKVEELASHGMSYDQIADNLGIGRHTFLRHRQNGAERADLAEAIKRGRAKGVEYVANALWEQIDKKNLGAIIFFLKTQGGWKETNRTELTGAEGSPLTTASTISFNVNAEQANALLDKAYANQAANTES